MRLSPTKLIVRRQATAAREAANLSKIENRQRRPIDDYLWCEGAGHAPAPHSICTVGISTFVLRCVCICRFTSIKNCRHARSSTRPQASRQYSLATRKIADDMRTNQTHPQRRRARHAREVDDACSGQNCCALPRTLLVHYLNPKGLPRLCCKWAGSRVYSCKRTSSRLSSSGPSSRPSYRS